ncbi:hypothetical protein ASG14_08235 [Pedobacter sp. Leaf194]|nr:hypothetical protein ASG14_08235 [Pedobacter sp. Leaf194]
MNMKKDQQSADDHEEVKNANIGLQAFSEEEEDVSGGQLGGLKEDGDNVVPSEQNPVETVSTQQLDKK